jgi:hypothetical protein
MSTTLTHSGSNASSDDVKPSTSIEKPYAGELAHNRSELATAVEYEDQSRKERLSGIFTIICSGFALISDGLQNNIMVSFFSSQISSLPPRRSTLHSELLSSSKTVDCPRLYFC